MGYIIGIDGGGTETNGLLTYLNGDIVASANSGPSNYHVVGVEQTHHVLKDIIAELTSHVGSMDDNSIRYCIGMAGLGREDDREVIGEICDNIGIPTNRLLTHDAYIALVGGIGKQEGIIVISGTGSIVFGIDSYGKEVRAGGWGFLLGDEGSGYDMAIKGLQSVARAADKRQPPTKLTQLLLKKLNLNDPTQLIKWTHAASRDEIAKLSEIVFQCQNRGDYAANSIIDDAADELTYDVDAVINQSTYTDNIDIVLSGGNLLHQPIFVQKLKSRIEKRNPRITVSLPKNEPAYGAVILAKAHL